MVIRAKKLAFSVASAADKIGLRRPLAWAMSRAYGGRNFSVDERGHWVNQQRSGSLVSPSIHTAPHSAIKSWVLRELCHSYVPRPGDVVFDIGAGIGEEATIFSRLVQPGGMVYAIEAHPDTFDCLRRTVELSHLSNVVPIQCAVSDQDGEMMIAVLSDSHLSNSVVAGEGSLGVSARTIASIAKAHGVERIDYLYMNIEGAERLAILGIGEIEIRNMLISCHDFCADAAGHEYRTREEVRSFLETHGFRITGRPSSLDKPWVNDYLYAASSCSRTLRKASATG